MNGFNYNLDEIATTITNFEEEIEKMINANDKITPKLEILKEEWTSTAATPTIQSIESFLNDDFSTFINKFNESKERLEVAKRNFQSIDEVG